MKILQPLMLVAITALLCVIAFKRPAPDRWEHRSEYFVRNDHHDASGRFSNAKEFPRKKIEDLSDQGWQIVAIEPGETVHLQRRIQ